MINANRLPAYLAGAAVLAVVVVSVLMLAGGDGSGGYLSSVPDTPQADADNPTVRMKMLENDMTTMRSRMVQLQAEKDEAIKKNAQLSGSLDQVTNRLQSLETRPLPETDTGMIDDLMARIDSLSGQVGELQSLPVADAYPVGGTVAVVPPGCIAPLDAPQACEGDWAAGGLAAATTTASSADFGFGGGAALADDPRYTVPENATLMDAIALTAMIGRIPVGGNVADPFPVKVITGPENLAANGLWIPGVQGMIWRGFAVGDRTLNCVRANLVSVTFVFEDGTIRTVRNAASGASSRGGGNQPLATLSDPQGIPCVSGKLVSNAASYLAGRTLVVGTAAAADAVARSESTTIIGGATGTATTVVDGDTGRYAAGQAAADGLQEIAQWLDERQATAFDAVVVPPGHRVAIHVEQPIRIDYEPNGRRLQYAHYDDHSDGLD